MSGEAKPGSLRERLVRGSIGSNGLGAPSFGLADLTPLGIAFAAEEAGRAFRRGDRLGAATLAVGAIPLPRR
jgi:hypothetical protein